MGRGMMIHRKAIATGLLAAFVLGMATPNVLACEGGGGGGVLKPEHEPLEFGEVELKQTGKQIDKFKIALGTVEITEVLVPTASGFTKGTDECTGKTLVFGKAPEECKVEVKYTPTFEDLETGFVDVKEKTSLILSQTLTGEGMNKVTLESLTWLKGETTTKVSKLKTLANITVKEIKVTDTTDFGLPGKKCKAGSKATETSPCEIEVSRLTTTPASATLEVTYKDDESGKTGTATASLSGS